MQLDEQPRKVTLAFAENGEKTTIPENNDPADGLASLNNGFPPKTRQALDDDGIPPFGQDMNGILYLVSAINRWQSAGASFVYDADFATDDNVNGYPKGAILLRADGTGFWVNQIDDNETDPDASGTNWHPINNVGITSKTMTGSNVTLTALESAKDVIVISGTLTANVNLIFPTTVKQWLVVNNTSGAFTLTAKTASGAGGLISQSTSRIFYGDGTNLYGVNPLASTQTQVDTGTDDKSFVTPTTFKTGINNIFDALGGSIKVAILQAIYPVGTPYYNKVNANNPNDIFGVTVGTWSREEARFLVGYKSGDDDFGTAGGTGGERGTVMTTANLIEHAHGTTAGGDNGGMGINLANGHAAVYHAGGATAPAGSATPDPIAILPPFIVYHFWVRTA